MAMTEEQYRADKAARSQLTEQSLKVSEQSQPTPTQEENDLLALGLMHPDDKASPETPQMPSLANQQAMLEEAAARSTPGGAAPRAGSTRPAPAVPRHSEPETKKP